jgi:hypothetical protein
MIKRTTKYLIAVALTLCVAVTAAGCGAVSHVAGTVVAHDVANHFAKTPAEKSLVNKAFCVYNAHRVLVDLRTHHSVAAAAQAAMALRTCEAGFAHHH